MEYDKNIADMQVGDKLRGFYLLKSAVSRNSSSNKPFLSAVLSDITGDIDAKVWDYSGPIGQEDEGTVIKIQGTVTEYKGKLQLTIERLRRRDDGDIVNMALIVPVAPIDADAAYQRVTELVDSMEDADYAAVCLDLLEKYGEDLKNIPAAKTVHHSFIHGLLMHTSDMMNLADVMAKQYSSIVNRDLLLAGTLLHDIAKTKEFAFSDLGLVTDYSVPGQLLGHLYLGAQEVADAAQRLNVPEEKSILLQHMILSHHGEPEFGAAVRPACPEAELLSHIDMIDSRMEIYRENIDKAQPGGFTQRIFALDRRIYRHT